MQQTCAGALCWPIPLLDRRHSFNRLQQDTLDLSHGQREFLTRELAEDALEPLLADGSAIAMVGSGLKVNLHGCHHLPHCQRAHARAAFHGIWQQPWGH